MKAEYRFSEHGLAIKVQPETVQELADLVRFSKNAKQTKPDIWLSLPDKGEPTCSIYMQKRDPKNQKNYINPKTT